MPILNYTTTIDGMKTVGEIQAILAKHGATSISVDFESSQPVAVTFLIAVNQEFINFRLPSNHKGVLKAMQQDRAIPTKYKTEAQAKRVAWRIVKDWVEAQMAIIQAGIASLPEVFLPYAVIENGQTLFQVVQDKGLKLLSS